jgi:LysM repeat protein
MCGAPLKEQKGRAVQLSRTNLTLPLLLAASIVILWLWKPWQVREPQAMAPALESATSTATLPPSATYEVVPTATPLFSPTPAPILTLPPNQTRHTVKSGEMIGTIAKDYGTTSQAILQANGLKENSIISVGQELIIPLPVANTLTPTPTATPSPTPFVYTVKQGETLSAIAKRYNTTVEALMQANGIADATRIRAGTQINIVQPPDFKATMAYDSYKVEQGDTLYTIAAKYHLTIATIKEVNNLQSDSLKVGQTLRIPIGTATPAPTLTPTATLTPTPGPPRPAPALLAPADKASFDGADTVILLNWASIGILNEDEWYVVRMRRAGTITQQLPLVWTKATSWRVPAELYVQGADEPERFTWQVLIMRQTGTREDGSWIGETISPNGLLRTFSWK